MPAQLERVCVFYCLPIDEPIEKFDFYDNNIASRRFIHP